MKISILLATVLFTSAAAAGDGKTWYAGCADLPPCGKKSPPKPAPQPQPKPKALTAKTGQNPPTPPTKAAPPSANTDRDSKPPVCEYVCTAYNDDGACVQKEYRCN